MKKLNFDSVFKKLDQALHEAQRLSECYIKASFEGSAADDSFSLEGEIRKLIAEYEHRRGE